MSPKSILKYFRRFEHPAEIRTDPLGEFVQKGGPDRENGHPPPSLVRSYRGEDSVRPVILSDAVNFLVPPRNTGDPEILHPINTDGRAKFWNIGYEREPEETPVIYLHDWSERKRLGGNYAVLRLVTDPAAFGPQYKGAAEALTNFRGTIVGHLEQIFYDLRLADPQLSNVREHLKRIKDKVGMLFHQSNEYTDLTESITAYENNIRTLGWTAADLNEVRGILVPLKDRIKEFRNNLIPGDVIKRNTSPFFDDLFQHVGSIDTLVLDSNCQLHPGEGRLMHKLKHLQYSGEQGSYLESLLAYSIEQTKSVDPLAHVPMMVKLEETADNLRKEAVMTPYRSHMAYHKAMAVAGIGDKYLAFLQIVHHPEAVRINLALRFLKSELLRRVIGDWDYFSRRADTDQRDYAPWVAKQFKMIMEYVGPEVEHYMLLNLEGLRKMNESEKEAAEATLTGYRKLRAITSEPRGKIGKRLIKGIKNTVL